MSSMIVVEEHNQDGLSRKAGRYLYTDTKLWLDGDVVHRGDGPAVILPDGAEHWYVRGKDVTRDVYTFFLQNKWPVGKGLDTTEKLSLFQEKFIA